MGENIHSSRSDSKATGSTETTSSRAEEAKREWGKGFDDFQWQNHSKKKTSVQQHELKCFYINARSFIHKFEHFEAWVQDLNPDVIGVTESWAGPK